MKAVEQKRPRKSQNPKRSKRKGKDKYLFTVIIEKDEAGFFAECPTLSGCFTQGDTYEEALKNIREAIEVYLEDLVAEGEKIPASDMVSVAAVEVHI